MSCNNFLSINNNIITVKGINTNDVWNITVINANFMLSKYNGRGPSNDISIIPFPNVGDGLYGDIVFSVNNNSCFKDCITNVNGDGSYFNVSPKYVTLHEKNETYNITVSSDCENFTLSNENIDLISTPNSGTNYFTITSNTDASFENIEIIVTNNCNGLEEIVYVSQKPSQEDPKLLTVNPQYINLSGDDKDFKINVISICNGNTAYTYDESVEGITLDDDGNFIYGTITSTENIKDRTFTVSNNCYSKTVTVNYSKEIVSETYICINSNKDNCKSSTTYNFTTGGSLSTSYTINSSSNWYISTYDSNKVNCSKSGNNIIISLGDDRTECKNEKIILKNKDGNEAIINYSVGAGLDVNDNIIFTFADGSKELNLTADTNYSVSACVIAYKNDNNLKKPIKWVNNSSGSFKSPLNTYSGGTDNCVNVKFTALPIIITTQSESTKEYTITLQEQETYKTIKINVSVTKQCENKTIWTGLTVTASNMGKCDTTSSSIKVIASGINTNDKCESGETSTTISDYDVTYNPSGANETEISREVLITVVGKGDYINASGETIVTQAAGPCTPPPTYEEVYEWDRLIVSATNMEACDEESVLTIIAEGTKTKADGTDEDVEEDVSGKCKVTYEPSGTNETEEEREVTITVEFEGIDEEITVIQAAGPCSCEEKDVWTSITVSSEKENIEACDEIETLDIITVTAYGKHIGKDCNSATTSTTLTSSDYTITYTPNDKNQTNSEREISINVVGKGDYSHLSESTTITQAAGPCEKTVITVTFTGTFNVIDVLEDNKEPYGCDESYADLPSQIITESNISYTITGVDSVPSVLQLISKSSRFHLGQEHQGERKYTPTSLSGILTKPECTDNVSDTICKQFEQSCMIYEWNASLTDETMYELIVINNVTTNRTEDETCSCKVESISATPSEHIFTSEDDYEFTITIVDDGCSGCTNQFDVYEDNTWVKGGSGTISLPNKDATYTVKASDDETKECTIKTTKYSIPDPVYIMQKTSSDTSTSITFPGDVTYDGETSYGYICCYSTKDGADQSVTTSSDSDWLTVESNNSLPYQGSNYNFKFTCTKNTSTSSRVGKITITQSGSNKTVTWTITQSGKPQSVVYTYTFKNCYSDRQLGLFASNASPSGADSKYAILSVSNGTSVPVLLDSIDGMKVNNSSNSTEIYAKIGDSIKVYSVQGQSWTLEETITLTAENRSFEYGCVDICSSVKVTCSPSQVTSGGSGFTNNGAKTTITVTGGTTNKWSVISTPEVDNTTSNNNSGTIYIGYKFGTYTIQSDECPEKTCTFKILKPEIRGIRIANNQPGTAKIYKTTQNTGKVLLGTLSNRGQEQVFNVTFDDHGTLDIEYESNNWRNDPSCYVYVRVEGDNLIQIGDPIKSGIDIIGGVEGATISANMNGSCSGSFATASGYYTIMINIKYAGYPCTGC